MGKTDSFFKEQTEASKLKADIVSKYFSGWASVMASQDSPEIAYLDLFCGPGRYEDGNPSTPLCILEKATTHKNVKVCKKIQLTFNDADSNNVEKVKREIENFPGIDKLHFMPSTSNQKIGQEIVGYFERLTQVPTLSFIDPWGYNQGVKSFFDSFDWI